MKLKDYIQTDDEHDIIILYGIRYSAELFRHIGLQTPSDSWIRIVNNQDGVVTMEVRNEAGFQLDGGKQA